MLLFCFGQSDPSGRNLSVHMVSVALSDWEYFYSPLDGMLVHRRVTPCSEFASTHLYTWVRKEALWE